MMKKILTIIFAFCIACAPIYSTRVALASEITGVLSNTNSEKNSLSDNTKIIESPFVVAPAESQKTTDASTLGLGILIGLVVSEVVALFIIDIYKKRRRLQQINSA